MDTDTSVSTDTAAATDTVAAGGADSGAALQTEMTGDFFHDDGSDAVVDRMGNKQLNENNEPIRTMDEFNAFKARKSGGQPQHKPISGKPAPTAKPAAGPTFKKNFDSMFEKNGAIDFDAHKNFGARIAAYNYGSATIPKADPNAQPAQPAAKPDPVAQIKTEVEKYSKELEAIHLGPLQSAWAKIVQQYGTVEAVPPQVANSMNAQWIAQQNQVRTLVDARKDELRDKQFQEQLSGKDFAVLETKSKENFTNVARELFPNANPNQHYGLLSELVFGYTYKDAQGKDAFSPGFGAEIVNHLFDIANSGKEFKTVQEWTDAYNKFWVNYASNPANIKWLAKQAYHNFDKAQETKKRDAYRAQWDKEQQAKTRQNTTQQPHATRGGNSFVPDAGTQQINKFLTVPQRAM
jgi:hypothetical protein